MGLFMKHKLKDEVMQIMPVQKQTSAGQRTRFKCVVCVGDYDGHIGMGTKCAKEVATAIRGGINAAKCGVLPVRRGYWVPRLASRTRCPLSSPASAARSASGLCLRRAVPASWPHL